jgi:ABC-type glycerol-3-phosphate transport system substrate-binding protein
MMRRLLVIAALAFLTAACGGSNEPEDAAAPQATGPGSEIGGDSIDGGRLSLADFRGKRVLVNVWSSW